MKNRGYVCLPPLANDPPPPELEVVVTETDNPKVRAVHVMQRGRCVVAWLTSKAALRGLADYLAANGKAAFGEEAP